MNMPQRIFRKLAVVFGILWMSAAVAWSGIADDPEVKSLKEKADAAGTQTEMNLVSKEICDLLDRRLEALEVQIRKELTGESVSLFEKAAAAWRSFRTAQVLLEGSFYEGGSIQPLVHNQAYSALTETHIDELLKFKEENLEDR